MDRVHDLIRIINREANMDFYKSLVLGNPFIKLSYKKRVFRDYTKDAKVTYYGYIKSKFLSAD